MPLYRDFTDSTARILVWEFDECETLDPRILLEDEMREKFASLHPKRQAEVLMVRRMLKKLCPNDKILYRENGEPYLASGKAEISVSHSFPFAALAVSTKRIGIDLERIKPKIERIRHKFILHEDAFIDDENAAEYLTIIWSVKESLYKLHHSKYWSLKKNYEVMPFMPVAEMSIDCRVYDENFSDDFTAKVYRFADYCFAVTSPRSASKRCSILRCSSTTP